MKIKIGAIIEIPTKKGLSYAQYTHKHEDYGALIRVIEGFYDQRPDNLEELASQPYTFSVFFPLGTAIKRKIFIIIGHASVALHGQQFPVFKTGFSDPITNKVVDWFLWDGHKKWYVGSLTEEEKDYPFVSIINDTLLIERIEQGWKNRDKE